MSSACVLSLVVLCVLFAGSSEGMLKQDATAACEPEGADSQAVDLWLELI